MKAEEILVLDSENIAKNNVVEWNKISNSSVLITGATGLIGTTVVRGIMTRNKLFGSNIHVYAFVRNVTKAESVFAEYMNDDLFEIVVGNIVEGVSLDVKCDFIIHAASETASCFFVDKPVETINTAVIGTWKLLDYARKNTIKAFIYLSSMEVYGVPAENVVLTEEKMGYINPMSVRSSYSESKRMVENLCSAYFSEYGIPTVILRLTQTFGPGVLSTDKRVFAEFANCAINNENIVLRTKGKTKRMYLYTADAVTAILIAMTKAKTGDVYNVANPSTYCSIYEMAELVMAKFGSRERSVIIDEPDIPVSAYNPTAEIFMDVSKISALGWKPLIGLEDMFDRMIRVMLNKERIN